MSRRDAETQEGQAKAGSPLRFAPAVQIRAWSAGGVGKERVDGRAGEFSFEF